MSLYNSSILGKTHTTNFKRSDKNKIIFFLMYVQNVYIRLINKQSHKDTYLY
jgi:hypothetical protein